MKIPKTKKRGADTPANNKASGSNKRQRAAASGPGMFSSRRLLSYPLIGSLIALAGVLLAFAFLHFTVIADGNARFRDRLSQERLQSLASYVNSRTASLNTILSHAATNPSTLAALRNNSPSAKQAVTQALQAATPYLKRAAIFAPEEADKDLTAAVPINFAAKQMIEKAGNGLNVDPEAYLVGDQLLVYAARTVKDAQNDEVLGSILLVMAPEYFSEPLKSFDIGKGGVQFLQQFANGRPVGIAVRGKVGESLDAPFNAKLDVPHWRVAYTPGANLSSSALTSPNAAFLPLLFALIAVGGAFFLAYYRLIGALSADANSLLKAGDTSASQRSRGALSYRLAVFQNLGAQLAKSTGPADATAPETQEAQDDEDQTETAVPIKGAGRTDPVLSNDQAADHDLAVDLSEDDTAVPELDVDEFLDVEVVEEDDGSEHGMIIEELDDTSEHPRAAEAAAEAAADGAAYELDATMFRAYDIRGIVGQNLNNQVALELGRALGSETRDRGQDTLAVGCDGRISSPDLKNALINGIVSTGCNVIDVGEVATPLLYFAAYHLDTLSGVMVTGSHNPPDYNGFKMMIGGETLAEQAITAIHQRMVTEQYHVGDGERSNHDIIPDYLERVTSDVALAQPLKVVVDCGNGIAGNTAPELLTQLGCEVIPLFCEVDGTFPNHHPDPADPANMSDLIAAVAAENADLGIAFDGDGDRVGVVTETGRIIWPDMLMMLFARDIVSRNPGADIIYDVKCSRHLNAIVSEYGGRPIMWKTGHSHIKAKIQETGALLGGEFSGHICFLERWYGFDDGLYSAARLLEILASEALRPSEVFAEFPATVSTPEIKIHTTEEAKFAHLERIADEANFENGSLATIDGVRVDYANGWGLVRASNTSPVLTLRFEADNNEALEHITGIFRRELSAIDESLAFEVELV